MKKKLLIISIITILSLLVSTYSFADDNMIDSAGNEIKDSADKVQNTIENAGDSVREGIENPGEAAGNMVESAGNTIKDASNTVTDGIETTMNTITEGGEATMNTVSNMTSDNGYNTTRTTTEETESGFMDTTNTWMWVTLAVIAIAIIGLVWYYATQMNNNSSRH